MNLLIFITASLAVVSARKPPFNLKEWKGYKEGDRYFYYPGHDGKAYLVDSLDPVDEDAIRDYMSNPVNNGYWLFTRKNPLHKQDLIMGNKSSIIWSYYDCLKTTVFISHGWRGDGHTEMNQVLTKVLLKDGDVNVIVLDWSTLANKNYVTASVAVPQVGHMLGKFINWLRRVFSMRLRNVHLVGFSLGGHLVGNAGKELRRHVVRRITALDPAGPLWYLNKNRLAKTDAKYVEVIHTNSFWCGYAFPLGHSDHYPNGGKQMIGCRWWDIVCHHTRSWRYMASTIENNKFAANKCKNICEAWCGWCSGKKQKMGNSLLNKHQRGVYRINTKAHYPYI